MTLNANAYDTLPDAVTEIFGEEATAERAYDLLTVDVPTASWIGALEIARDKLGCTYFDWLSAVDEPGTGFRVCAHVASVGPGHVRRLLLRTTVPHASPALPSAVAVYAGAAWHERETYEMFGVTFTDHPHLVHLLLPENFEGHPLRKDFVLAARVAKAWPGAKEPGEAHDPNAPKRRQMLPPGVPDPNEWGPLKGQLPPAPTRPTRAAAGDRPARRTRTAAEGSATQPDAAPDPSAPARRARTATAGSASQRPQAPEATGTPTPEAPTTPRRSRSASAGSASQRAEAAEVAEASGTPAPEAPTTPRRSRSASAGSASQRAEAAESAEASGTPAPEAPAAPPAGPRRNRSASAGSASQRAETGAPQEQRPAPRTRSADAPWHHARPAFDEKPEARDAPAPQEPPAKDETPDQAHKPEPGPADAAPAEPEPGPVAEAPAEGPGPRSNDPDPHDTDPQDPAGGDPA